MLRTEFQPGKSNITCVRAGLSSCASGSSGLEAEACGGDEDERGMRWSYRHGIGRQAGTLHKDLVVSVERLSPFYSTSHSDGTHSCPEDELEFTEQDGRPTAGMIDRQETMQTRTKSWGVGG
ncbi:unnamed protein product [Diplocarpon coronariae]